MIRSWQTIDLRLKRIWQYNSVLCIPPSGAKVVQILAEDVRGIRPTSRMLEFMWKPLEEETTSNE